MEIKDGGLVKVTDADIVNGEFIVPEGVTSIGDRAFEYCRDLINIIIPEGVTSIRDRAFEYCRNLTNITLPNGIISIGDRAFCGCKNLTNITLPEGITSIGDYTFWGCDNLTNITIPEGVTSIGDHAFWGCDSLTNITIPERVTSIGDYAFWGCDSLTNITIPEGVTLIGDSVFAYCRSLTDITIPEGITSIGFSAFCGCNSLINIIIPEGVTLIGDSAFEECSNLANITIPEGVTSIGDNTFEECSSLKNITIPEGITSIGVGAFKKCSSLMNIVIPEGVVSIGNCAFAGCGNLTNITIPEGVTSIGDYVFFGCNISKVKADGEEMNIVDFYNKYKDNGGYSKWLKVEEVDNIKITRNIEGVVGNVDVNTEFLLKNGLIDTNLEEEEQLKRKEEIEQKVLEIFKKSNFYLSEEYTTLYESKYLIKMIEVLGLDLTEQLLTVPRNMSQAEMSNLSQKYQQELQEVYEKKYTIHGDLPVICSFINAINSNIRGKSRKIFFEKFNEKLGKLRENNKSGRLQDNDELRNIISLIREVKSEVESENTSEIEIKISEMTLKKLQLQINERRFSEKSEYIKSKIDELVQNADVNHIGFIKNIVYNSIKKNMLQDGNGTIENLEKILNEELRKNSNKEWSRTVILWGSHSDAKR